MKKNFLCSLLTLVTCCTLTNTTLTNTQTKEKIAIIAVGENLKQSPKISVTKVLIHPSTKNPLSTQNILKSYSIVSLNKLKSLLPKLKKQFITPKGIGCTVATILYLFFSYRQGTMLFWKWKSTGYIKLEKENEALITEKADSRVTIEKLIEEKEKLEKLSANQNAKNIEELAEKVKQLEEKLEKLNIKK